MYNIFRVLCPQSPYGAWLLVGAYYPFWATDWTINKAPVTLFLKQSYYVFRQKGIEKKGRIPNQDVGAGSWESHT